MWLWCGGGGGWGVVVGGEGWVAEVGGVGGRQLVLG